MSTTNNSFNQSEASAGSEKVFFSAKKDLLKTLGKNLPANPTGTAKFLKDTLEFRESSPSDSSQYSQDSSS